MNLSTQPLLHMYTLMQVTKMESVNLDDIH